MKIWINRAGQNLGTFTLEEIQRGLEQGLNLPTDLAWQEGMESWKPLSDFPGITIPATPAPGAVLAPGPIGAPTAPPVLEQRTPVVFESTEDGPAWERRSELGIAKALFTTWKEVLLTPGPTFSRMKSTGGYGSPLLFHLLMTVISILFVVIYQLGQMMLIGSFASTSASAHEYDGMGVLMAGGGIMFVVWFLLAIPLVVGFNFVAAAILHLCLSLFKGTSKPYEATYRVLCYASSALILSVVPCVGSMAASIWALIAEIIGLARVHKTEGWRAACAIFLPLVVCIGVVLVIYGVIIAMVLGSGRHSLES
jgi:hypothetical protein